MLLKEPRHNVLMLTGIEKNDVDICFSEHQDGWRLRGSGGPVQRGALVRNLLQSAGGASWRSSREQHAVQWLIPACGTSRGSGQWTVKWDKYQFFKRQVGTNGGFWDIHSQFRYSCSFCPFDACRSHDTALIVLHPPVGSIYHTSFTARLYKRLMGYLSKSVTIKRCCTTLI